MTKHYVFVGLGNPGKKYELTRHNLGFLVIQAFANNNEWRFKEEKQFQALVSKGQIAETTIHLLLPLTYMNESGRAVRSYLDFYKLTTKQLLIIADDVALPFGEMRLRKEGSPGGHNGLKSIEACLSTRYYARLRMGIGPSSPRRPLADHVLDSFTAEEFKVLPEFVAKATTVLNTLVHEKIENVMNRVNAPPKTTEGQKEVSQENKHEEQRKPL